MKYNIMIGVLLVESILYCEDDIEIHVRIKQLEDARWKIARNLAKLEDELNQEVTKYKDYSNEALIYWKPFLDGEMIEASFEAFLDDLIKALYVGGDIDSIFAKAPWMNYQAIRIRVLSASFKALCVNRICSQYEQLVKEFIELSSELSQLR